MGRFVALNATVLDLIKLAYGPPTGLADARVVGAPDWAKSERFDVEGKAEDTVMQQQLQLMLRALLAERFGLALRQEVREMPVYALVVVSGDGRLGPRLQRSEDCTAPGDRRQGPGDTTDPSRMCGGGGSPGRRAFGGIPLAQGVLPTLARETQRIVVDRTGLTGFFDGSLEWAPNTLAAAGAEPPQPTDAPSIFTAVQEQLGLKLEPSTAAVEVFVVASVTRPTAN